MKSDLDQKAKSLLNRIGDTSICAKNGCDISTKDNVAIFCKKHADEALALLDGDRNFRITEYMRIPINE